MRMIGIGGVLAVLVLTNGCKLSSNRAISTTRSGAVTETQNETSVVRIPNGAGPGVDRLVVAYNDFTGTKDVLDGGAYQLRQGASRLGWAYSDDLGVTWHAQPQISVAVPDGGVPLSLIGDPYLAVVNGMVLYVGLARESPTGQNTDIILARLPFQSTTFEPAQSIAKIVPGGGGFDGCKIATTPITGPNALAIVTWRQLGGGVGYVVLSDLEAMPSVAIAPRQNFLFPPIHWTATASGVGCVVGATSPPSSSYEFHPEVRVGTAGVPDGVPGFAYIGVQSRYTGAQCTEQRFEIYRSRLQAAGVQIWERIMSQPSRTLSATFLSSTGNFGRSGLWGSIGVSRKLNEDIVTLAATELGSAPGEIQHQSVRLMRVPEASNCTVPADTDGCPMHPANDFDPEQSFRLPFFVGGGLMVLHSSQLGASRLQPTIVSSPSDSRVAVFWYSQPFRWLNVLPANRRRYWTTVEGVYSTDAGEHFGPLRRIVVQPSSVLQDLDAGPGTSIGLGTESTNALNANAGLMFDPCLYQVNNLPEYFFGDYISGTFLRDAQQQGTEPFAVYATWADSRNGCVQQAMGAQSPVYHQHVFGGAW